MAEKEFLSPSQQGDEREKDKSNQQKQKPKEPVSEEKNTPEQEITEAELAQDEQRSEDKEVKDAAPGGATELESREEAAEEINIDELKQKIQQLEQEKEELINRLLRLQADFDNYRKRVRAEMEELESYANFNLIRKLLPVLDNMERACAVSGECSEGILEGVQMILRQFKEILKKEGVVPIECEGEPFDPSCHEAVMKEKREDVPPNTIVEELQKGYRMKDKILRASMVKVSSEE